MDLCMLRVKFVARVSHYISVRMNYDYEWAKLQLRRIVYKFQQQVVGYYALCETA